MSWLQPLKTILAQKISDVFTATRISSSESGRRGTEFSQQRAIYERLTPSYDLYSTIQDIRQMDAEDGIVKEIHGKTAKALTKGGLVLTNPSKNKRIAKVWKSFVRRTELNNRLKLISDARGLVVEGSLPLQWVLDQDGKHVIRCIRMPTETIRPIVGINGQFENPSKAYVQYSFNDGRDIASFAAWQLHVARLDPDNYDDKNSLGRPLLDATRKRWRQQMMTLDDSVKRRHLRAGNRTHHVLEGADEKTLAEYKRLVETEENTVSSNYYSNRPGSVNAIEGDANLEQIADIALIMDAFFAGSGMPKALLGLNLENMSRDILLDMKAEWYDSLDILQDSLASSYEHGFRLELLLQGINPEAYEFSIGYGERLAESLNQRTDRALKIRSMGASRHTTFLTAGLDPAAEETLIADEMDELEAYPEQILPGVPDDTDPKQKTVTITPGNGGKGESATSIKSS